MGWVYLLLWKHCCPQTPVAALLFSHLLGFFYPPQMSYLSFTYHYHRTEKLSLTIIIKTVYPPCYSIFPMLPGFPFYHFYRLLCYRWLDVLIQVCCSNKISEWFIIKGNLFLAVLEAGSWRLGGPRCRMKLLSQVAVCHCVLTWPEGTENFLGPIL